MGRSMNYDGFAQDYAVNRWAVPWILAPLNGEISTVPGGSTVLEIGCGTGNYIVALSQVLPDYRYHGFDMSSEMLSIARSRSSGIEFSFGDAEQRFPYPESFCRIAFAVDVLHHIEKLDVFFLESARVLDSGGKLLVVTDSEDNIRSRSLTRYFPEILSIELDRYPALEELHAAADRASLRCIGTEPAEGEILMDEGFIAKLESRCSSAMRIISSEAHRRGIHRVRAAGNSGEKWFSCYTVVKYVAMKHDSPVRRTTG